MMRDLDRRIGRIEADQGAIVAAEIRAWLGDPVTDAERARMDANPPLTDAEQCATATRLPASLQAWLDERA